MMPVISPVRWLALGAACALSACAAAETKPAPSGGGSGGGGRPTIASFSATPGTLPPGGGAVSLSWSVGQADTITIDQGVGAVAGSGNESVSVTATTTFTLIATNANGTSTASTVVRVGSGGGSGAGRFAAMVVPVDGETFAGSAIDLRLIGIGYDPNNWASTGPGGGLHQAASLQFILDGNAASPLLTVDVSSAEYWVFQGFANAVSLSPGAHTIVARAVYTTNPGPAETVDSPPVTITVVASPTYGQTIDMVADQSLAQMASLVGTSGSRIRVNGNGHGIIDAGSSTAVNWQYVDFYGMGDPGNTSANGIDVTTTGGVTVQNCTFDYSNPVRFSIGGTATASVRGNLWRSNMRQPLGQLPYGDSFPAVQFAGGSTGAKVFAGNNVATGWVDFQAVNNWTVGGTTDADSNVLIGARVGVFFDWQSNPGASKNNTVRRNFSHHIYYGGWSQGSNFELSGSPSILAEHNVLAGSSWTIRGVGGEFRYNLVLDGGEDWMWVNPNAFVHHNVFVGGDLNRGGVYNTYGYTGIRILNNTFDGMTGPDAWNAIYSTGSETVNSNVFVNVSTITGHSPIDIGGGVLTADYNLFWNSSAPYYSDGRPLGPNDKSQDPMLTSPATTQFEFDESAIWNRTKTTYGVLQDYRAKYSPAPGSPVIDAGDTATFGAGNDIGAIGAGASNPADLFGL